MSHRSLLVFPDDTSKSIVDAIHAAKKLIRIKMFIFSDPELIQAVIDAKGRGVEIKIMLNPARRTGEQENEGTRALLEAAGIEVRDSSPSFGITHEKSLVVDDEVAFIQSLNWEIKDLTQTRDFAIITHHKHEVEEVIAGFEADWHRQDFDPGHEAHLIWCKGNGRERMARLIRQCHAHALRPERALSGSRHHRGRRPRRPPRRQGPRPRKTTPPPEPQPARRELGTWEIP